jgi:hypothetical protein
MTPFTNYLRFTIATIAIISLVLSACVKAKTIEYDQLFEGFNGPRNPHAFYFESKSSIDNSWIKLSLNKGEYEKLLSKIDFGHQILVAVAVGERESASGAVKITYFRQLTDLKNPPMDISALVGIVGSGCAKKGLISYPFALAVFERPEKFQTVGGIDIGNFDDGCKTEKSGEPNDPR